MNGFLVPVGEGDPVPLVKEIIVIGRRPECDIELPYSNVSGRHCELRFKRGTWIIQDLQSTNGVKVNGVKVARKRLVSGDEISIARQHLFRIEYELSPAARERLESEPPDATEEEEDEPFRQTLLERAGLSARAPIYEPDDDDDENINENTNNQPSSPKKKKPPRARPE